MTSSPDRSEDLDENDQGHETRSEKHDQRCGDRIPLFRLLGGRANWWRRRVLILELVWHINHPHAANVSPRDLSLDSGGWTSQKTPPPGIFASA